MVNTQILTLSQVYQSRKIILELMETQGYDISGYEHFSIGEINAMKHNNQLDMLLESKPASSDKEQNVAVKKVYIRYYLAKTIRPVNLQEMIDDLFVLSETLQKSDTLYIIIKDTVNDTLMNELKEIWERDGIFIVIENIKSLQFNILKHTYVPNHTIMSEDEVNEVMVRYNIKDKSQFPDISRFDPVARAICMRPRQVCRITRPSKTAISSYYYRYCV